MTNNEKKKEITCKIIETYGQIAEYNKDDMTTNKTRRLSLISWNGKTPKFDIREWSNTGTAYKGITFSIEEFQRLKELINNIDIDDLKEKIKFFNPNN